VKKVEKENSLELFGRSSELFNILDSDSRTGFWGAEGTGEN